MSDIYVEHDRLGTGAEKGKSIGLVLFPLFLSLVYSYIAIDIYLAYAEEEKPPLVLVFDVEGFIEWIVILILALGCLIVSILTFTDYWSKIRVCKDGVLVRYPYPFIREKLIPWEAFQIVSICTHSNPSRFYLPPKVYVCMIKHGEKKDLRGNWKIENPFHFTRVIRLKYTPELVCFLQEKCGITVKDQRNILGMPVDLYEK